MKPPKTGSAVPPVSAAKPSRRHFLLASATIAGAVVVGWGVMPPRQRLNLSSPIPVRDGLVPLNGWVRIGADGMVTIAIPRSEMGQGVMTALPMLIAEEMDIPLSMVRTEQAPLDKIFGNIAMLRDGLPFHPDDQGVLKKSAQWITGKAARELGLVVTGGSSSVKDAWEPMRLAGASARAMLVSTAAAQWKVSIDDCHTDAGFVVDRSGRRLGYGALAAQAAGATIGKVRVKDPKQFKLIGTPQPRRDSRAKVDGSAIYGIDARPPGLVYAAIRMAPTIGGGIKSIDADAVRTMPGLIGVVDFSSAMRDKYGAGAGVAVIANHYWQAKQAVTALPVYWTDGPQVNLTSAAVMKDLAWNLDTDAGHVYYSQGDLDAGRAGLKTVKAEYSAPFLAHATMEPINCTAQVKDGKVLLWVSTQVPGMAVSVAAKVAGVKAEDVSIVVPYLGGGFGRRLEVDMVAQAVAIARQAGGRPVQVIWSREDDMTHDVYRPAAMARFTAALDAAGNVLAYDNKSASGAVTHQVVARNFGLVGAGPDKTTVEGAFDMPYEFANQRIAHVVVPTPVPLGYWRSVGHSHNAFFKESFISELAHAAGKDPVAFRRGLLARHPRHLAVLDAAVARAGKPVEGHAHGVALHQSFGTIVAQVAEVSIADGAIRVHKVTCAVDCGMVVNPNIVAQQMESGVIFGLSAALHGEITIEGGKIKQTNFHDYQVLRADRAPQVDTIILPSAAPPEGIGEPGVPPIAPAVADAVFALTGKRLRSLPLRLDT